MFESPKPNMRDTCERDESGTRPVLEEGEEVLYECRDVTFALAPDALEGSGSLVVTSKRVVWLSGTSADKAFDFDVPYICLHAVSRDPHTFPLPCIYCQLDEDDDVLKEAFFAPSDETLLSLLFAAFSRAAELNPDLPEAGGDDFGGGEFGEDELFVGDGDGGGNWGGGEGGEGGGEEWEGEGEEGDYEGEGGEEGGGSGGGGVVGGAGYETYAGGLDGLIVDEAGLAGIGPEQASVLDRLKSVLTIGPGAQEGQFEDADADGGGAAAGAVAAARQNGGHETER
ncbi:unnamed protein product [Phaeothamnion confervicola]